MQNGDISNQFAPAIVIDVDQLIIRPKKLGPLRIGYELRSNALKILHYLFSTNLSIYLVCQRKMEYQFYNVWEFLDSKNLPFNQIYFISSPVELEEVVTLPHVIRYFYHTSYPERTTIRVGERARQIDSLLEIYGEV